MGFEKGGKLSMNFFKKWFPSLFTDEELIEMGSKLRNRVLVLRMKSPYNKILVNDIMGIKTINDSKYIEFTGYNLNKQLVSMIVSLRTFIKLCNSESVFEASESDDIYLKDIKNID